MTEIVKAEEFSVWKPWSDIAKVSTDYGVYIIYYEADGEKSGAFSWSESIAYIGMTVAKSGLEGRLKAFDNTLRKHIPTHSGADRLRYAYRDVPYEELCNRLYFSIWQKASIDSSPVEDFLNRGEVVCFEYQCFATFHGKYGKLPIFNSLPPKYSAYAKKGDS